MKHLNRRQVIPEELYFVSKEKRNLLNLGSYWQKINN